MFNFMDKISNYFKLSENEEKLKSSNQPKLDEFVDVKCFDEENKTEKLFFKGVITAIVDGTGVINGEINFDKNILASEQFAVDDKVCGEASRSSSYEAWRAISLQLMEEDWDENNICSKSTSATDENLNIPNVILGKITSIYGGLVSLGNGISFLDDNFCKFELIPGDWLECEWERGEENFKENVTQELRYLKMTTVRPLRFKTINGVITKFQNSSYVINDEIFCSRKIFPRSVRLNTKVIVDVIESDQRQFSWRAISGKIDPFDIAEVGDNSIKFSELLKVCKIDNRCAKVIELSPSRVQDFLQLDNLLNNKHGIVIHNNSDYVKMKKDDHHSLYFTIKNVSFDYTQNLQSIFSYGYGSKIEIEMKYHLEETLPISVEAKGQIVVMVQCHSRYEGNLKKLLLFDFGFFAIGKFLQIEISNKASQQILGKQFKGIKAAEGRIIRGEKPQHASPFIPIKLPHANIPESLMEEIENGDILNLIPCLDEPLSESNYVEKFTNLLYLEEMDMAMKMRQYSISRCCFTHHGEFLALEVPGLNEGRPSLVVGDSIIASMPITEDFADASFLLEGRNNKEDICYEGCIHKVLNNNILLRFHPSFHQSYSDEDYSVSFHYSRTPFRRCHMAITYARSQLGAAVLFPKKIAYQLPQVPYIDSEKFSINDSVKINRISDEKLFIGSLASISLNEINKGINEFEAARLNKTNSQYNSHLSSSNKKFLQSFLVENTRNKDCKNGKVFIESVSNNLRNHILPPSVEYNYIVNNGNSCTANARVGNNSARESSNTDDYLGSLKRSRKLVKMKIPRDMKADYRGYCTPKFNIKQSGDSLSTLTWFNHDLNPEQRAAVKRILEGSTRPLPYVLFGPPGTGKTVTIVEAILQIYTLVKHSRILVVGPSNSACDLLAERLITSGNLTTGSLVRINAFNRSVDTISDFLEPYCNEVALSYRHRLIVMTGASAGQLYTMEIKNGHFSHIFIDEAGHMTEPEACISLGLVNSSSGQIVLAGDPHQLGPHVMSKLSNKFGLQHSLLHRLCSSPLYQPVGVGEFFKSDDSRKRNESDSDGTNISSKSIGDDLGGSQHLYEPRLVSLLTRNYRSHPDLIEISSRLFYHSSLLACADREITHSLLKWDLLPCLNCPLVFHPVFGKEQQECDSPSWFNSKEAFNVANYTKSLLLYGLNANDIGIITPYRKQVEKIRELLNTFQVKEDIKVGSVEEFQGQEKKAIILSTVRSQDNMPEDNDVKNNIGFLGCPRRFNVAITRAKSLLIIVGNPSIGSDPYWGELLTFCKEKKAIVGM